ncbi:hypothetical protein FCULG_00000251 [Fusarium culmorum]|uniref:Aminoglycoside phosphotransferase domain-containing protein n=1 Tax=Fusarium culmorum TaxID=5516 RepID=A0A2T4GNU3_FUSCU|nr:hypothetical protein FCULG_00000251 [Fusarium culmorum]
MISTTAQDCEELPTTPTPLDRKTLRTPPKFFPRLPVDEEWTVACFSRDRSSRDLNISVSNRTLPGVDRPWHHTRVNYLDLEETKFLTPTVREVVDRSTDFPRNIMIATMARFECELPSVEKETRAYQLLEGSGLAPRFLGHIHESGRIIGFLRERVEGEPASLQDKDRCQSALGRLHRMEILIGDVSQGNLLITEQWVKFLNFKRLEERPSDRAKVHQSMSMYAELVNSEPGCRNRFDFRGYAD